MPSTFQWLRTGEEALAAMLTAIGAASQSIQLEIYIFQDSEIGRKFRQALVDALGRGVKVAVMLDSLGSFELSESFWDELVARGGEFRWFNPLSLRRWSYRDHRKILVCDHSVAFIGGCNIAPEYNGDGVKSGWRDLGMKITGPLAHELSEAFDNLFARASYRHYRLQSLRKSRIERVEADNWNLLLSGPGRQDGDLRQTLVQDLAEARSVQILCAYFLPTWRLRQALVNVSRRGGRVQLILANKSDVRLSQLASRRLYQRLLNAGIEIYEYLPQILHAKLFLIDNVVYAGSANLDTRSLRINYELLVRISEPTLAQEARSLFAGDLRLSRRIEAEWWKKSRTFWQRFREDWAYFLLARVDPFLARRYLRNSP